MLFKAKEVGIEGLSFKITEVEEIKEFPADVQKIWDKTVEEEGSAEKVVKDCPIAIPGYYGDEAGGLERMGKMSDDEFIYFQRFVYLSDVKVVYFESNLSVEELEQLRYFSY